jgi:hypothetical protein
MRTEGGGEVKKARQYRMASTFLRQVKENEITYKKLKEVLFGEHTIAFIKAIRKHGQIAFKEIKKAHQFMYMVEVGIEECLKKYKKEVGNG